MGQTFLITGGTGLVGTRITKLLQDQGHQVKYLSRRAGIKNDVMAYQWDVANQIIDNKAFEGVDYIIHLAGAGVADKKWTSKRKNQILESRTLSTQLLKNTLDNIDHQVKALVSASAVGYYGWDTGNKELEENADPGNDFLAKVTKAWESKIDEIKNIRTVKLRIGIVFSQEGGALYELTKPIKYGFGAPLGNGQQYMSWIHIDDLCKMFIYAATHQNITGVYNAVGPQPTDNKRITQAVAKILNKPLFLPHVPAFVLRIMLGERAAMILGGNKVSANKIINAGFRFSFPNLEEALKDLLL